ncbi:MAG: HAD hydrolase-like protein [Lachnospiraceae bacterium]|nr:HAD hydrolase-like protein [Lachnospiraceae bacterium]
MWNTVLFDLDGTLTDSGEGITKCVQYALEKEFGIRVTDLHSLDHFVGPPLKEEFMKYANLTEEEGERAIRAYRERYTRIGLYENRLYDGVRKLCQQLSQHNFTLVLASSKPTDFCAEILRYFGIERYFKLIIGSEMDGSRTKKSEVIEECLLRLGMSGRRSEVVMVGDRCYDIVGAKAAGIASIGVTYGYGSYEELAREWPDCIVDSTVELRNVLIGQMLDAMKQPVKTETLTPYGKQLTPQQQALMDERRRSPYSPALTDEEILNMSPRAVSGGISKAAADGPVPLRIWKVIYPVLIDLAVSSMVGFIVGIVIFLFHAVQNTSGGGVPSDGNFMNLYLRHVILITGIADAVLLPIYCLLIRNDEKDRYKMGLGERILKKKKISVPSVLLIIGFTVTAANVFNQVTVFLPKKDAGYQVLEEGLKNANPIILLLAVCVIGPIMEELLFRGVIYRRLRDYMNVPWAAILSAAIFGLIHGNVTQGVVAGIFGIFLALIYEHYGTLTACTIAHIANNTIASFMDPIFSAMPDAAKVAWLLLCVAGALVLGYLMFFRDARVNRV